MPVTLEQWLAFAAAAAVVTIAPGPDNLAVLGIGLARGRRPAMAFGAGCGIGCLTHTTWAVLGVSALLAASPRAFGAVKWLGAGYLLWLGVNALRSSGPSLAESADGLSGTRRYFARGLLANAVNPKVALFFLAFLPQFVRSGSPVSMQMALFGVTFTFVALTAFAALGYFSGAIGSWLRARTGTGRWLDRASGCLFLGLGIRLLLSKR